MFSGCKSQYFGAAFPSRKTHGKMEEALSPHETNRQEAGEHFREFGYTKAGFCPDRKTVVLTFPFPDAEKEAAAAREIAEKTGLPCSFL